jgi:hypothetical protein
MSTRRPDQLDSVARYLAAGVGSDDIADTERTELDRVRALLSDESLWINPPPDLAESIVRRIETEPVDAAPRVGARRATWARMSVIGGLVAAAALVVAVLVVGRVAGPDGATQVAFTGTELAPAATGEATMRETESGVAITLRLERLEPAPAGFYYQAWVAGPAGSVPIGTFHIRDGDEEPIELWSGVDTADYPNVTVTIEPEDGNPASSGLQVLVGELR